MLYKQQGNENVNMREPAKSMKWGTTDSHVAGQHEHQQVLDMCCRCGGIDIYRLLRLLQSIDCCTLSAHQKFDQVLSGNSCHAGHLVLEGVWSWAVDMT